MVVCALARIPRLSMGSARPELLRKEVSILQKITNWSVPGAHGSCIIGNHSIRNENGYLIVQDDNTCAPLRIVGNVVVSGVAEEKNLQLMARNGKMYATGPREIYRVFMTDYNRNWARCAQMFPTSLKPQAV